MNEWEGFPIQGYLNLKPNFHLAHKAGSFDKAQMPWSKWYTWNNDFDSFLEGWWGGVNTFSLPRISVRAKW